MAKKFKVRVKGKNFLVRLNGKVQRVGFYATRFVEAKDTADAECRAMGLLAKDSTLRNVVLKESFPSMHVEKIEKLESFNGVSVPGKGFTLFRGELESRPRSKRKRA